MRGKLMRWCEYCHAYVGVLTDSAWKSLHFHCDRSECCLRCGCEDVP